MLLAGLTQDTIARISDREEEALVVAVGAAAEGWQKATTEDLNAKLGVPLRVSLFQPPLMG